MKISVEAAAINHMGNVRKNNEDNCYLNGFYMPLENMDAGCERSASCADLLQLYAVCDGMGGEEAGEQASYAAMTGMDELKAACAREKDLHTAMDAAIDKMNRAVCAIPAGSGAGSTAVLLCLRDGQAHVANVGDSRAYMLRKGTLFRLTTDHTELQRLLNLGLVTEEEAKDHAAKHVLSRYLGMQMEDCVLTPSYCEPVKLRTGDVFLLCSDGLTDCVAENEMARLLAQAPLEAAQALVQAALDASGHDNITVVVVKVERFKSGLFARPRQRA